jgi:hydroxymethylpyrimidine pyrophosphatase-like HAD family hydrolase
MRYLALCCDYDGTLATQGRVTPDTVRALERLKASGRRVLLVTGRELDDLATVAPPLTLFDFVVAENGALLLEPGTGAQTLLGARPPGSFVAALRERGVGPISVGRVIVATWEPHAEAVREVLHEQGLNHQVVLNKGAVMVLPPGVDKGTGLAAALGRLGLSPHNTVGVGDAENDLPLLAACECGVAVANALPTLKSHADLVTAGGHGAGVAELCEELLRDDLSTLAPRLARHELLLGHDAAGGEVRIPPYGERLLVLGSSREAHHLVTGLRRQLRERGYSTLALSAHRPGGPVSPGTERAPVPEAVIELLQSAGGEHVDVDLSGLPGAQACQFLQQLLAQLAPVRARRGRPHWILVEDGDVLSGAGPLVWPVPQTVVCTAQQLDDFARQSLSTTTLLIAIGQTLDALEQLCRSADLPVPARRAFTEPDTGALAWRPGSNAAPFALRVPRESA